MYMGGPTAMMDENGVAIGFGLFGMHDGINTYGVNANFNCYQLTNGAAATGGSELQLECAVMQDQASGANFPNLNKYPQYSVATSGTQVFGSRTYEAIGGFATSMNFLICYDGVTKAACANYHTFSGYKTMNKGIYGFVIDPADDGACVWGLGHEGVMKSWSSDDPREACGAANPYVVVTPADSYCAGATPTITDWLSVYPA